MAVSKELRQYLDKDGKGQYKKTRKNISKVLAYYGYQIPDIQKVFGTDKDYYSRYFEDGMLKREKITSRAYFTDEEKEMLEGFEKAIDKVYRESVGGNTKSNVVKKVQVKAKKPETIPTATVPSTKESVRDGSNLGVNEDDIKSSTLLNKLQQVTGVATPTRKHIEENREPVQRPVKKDTPTTGKCSHCIGRGWVMEKQGDGVVRKVVCPKCLGNPVKTESVEFQRYGKPLLEELIENRYYLDSTYSTRTLMEDNMSAYHIATRQFDNYLEFLNGMLTEVKGGDTPLKSYYIATPDGYGKKHFVYQLMKEMVAYGKKPTQLLNGGLLLDLYNKREFQQLNELMDGDMIFVTISALGRTKGIGNVIKYIADYAERKGLPVMMVGRVSVEVFLKSDDFNLPSLLGRRTTNGDFGHFQCEGFFGKDFNALARLQQERMSGSLVTK